MTEIPLSSGRRVKFDTACRAHFSLFLHRAMKSVSPGVRYLHNWHVEAIAAYLDACAKGEITRLIINLPPRMLKSTIVSAAWPAWLLGHNPSQRIMAASYAQALSLKHSTDCRVVMEADWYRRLFPNTQLCQDQNEKEKFSTTMRGYRRAVSVGGAAIGEGGNVLIIDDPLNPLQASHHHQRTSVNAWFDHTWATRLDDKQTGAMVVVMQRLHRDDLSGYLLEKGGWEHLCLPAIAPVPMVVSCGGFTYRRQEGEVLHEAREPQALLERAKLDLGSTNFAAQYQQAPVHEVGNIIRREWFVRAPLAAIGQGEGCVQSWDTGIKVGVAHDASACATFVLRDGAHVMVDMLVVRQEYPALKRTIMEHAARFAPEAILVEDKGSGQSLLQDLRREAQLPLIAVTPVKDKISRVIQATGMMEAGKLVLPVQASWLSAFEQEFFSFPDGAHDDQVDAVSQYLNWSIKRGGTDEMRLRRL